MIQIGTVLYGYCGGYFGRDSYDEKRVEGIGVDWVVARECQSGRVYFAGCSPTDLVEYLEPEPEEEDLW